jgi:hypothetical protein
VTVLRFAPFFLVACGDPGATLVADYQAANGPFAACGTVSIDNEPCSDDGSAGACLVAAFDGCTASMVTVERLTIEGAPIVHTYFVHPGGSGGCVVTLFTDHREDPYAEDRDVGRFACDTVAASDTCGGFTVDGCVAAL